jgi:hypothetical protein
MKIAYMALLALSFAAPAMAGVNPEGDKIVHAYVLTLPKVKAYDAAVQAAYAAEQQDPALKAEAQAATQEPADTVVQLRAKYDRHPRLYSFFKTKGLTRDDTMLLPFVRLAACDAAQDPKPTADPSTSPEQLAFCKANNAELQGLRMFPTTMN